MKAPDKIYVCIPQRLNLSTFKEDSKYVGIAYNDKGKLRSPQIEEYIRKDAILAIIQSRISEIIGDAQPKPILRAELEELIKRIKDED